MGYAHVVGRVLDPDGPVARGKDKSMAGWTKTEARRRMRAAAKIGAEHFGHRRAGALVEVGVRRMMAKGATIEEAKAARAANEAAGDDHVDFAGSGHYVPEEGELLHLFVRPKMIGDLYPDFDVIVVWVGAGDQGPAIAARY